MSPKAKKSSSSIGDLFDQRAASYTAERVQRYNSANARYPRARERERGVVLDRLSLEDGVTICDVAAGGGYLADGMHERLAGRCRILCVENSRAYSQTLSPSYERILSSLSQLALGDSSVDRVACLAGLHHQEDKLQFLREAHRVLRPGGVLVVADAQKGSPPAAFLNEAVDRWSDIGHEGMFLAEGEARALFERAGFDGVCEDLEAYTWDLPDEETLVDFCQALFRMSRARRDEVAEELHRYLRIGVDASGAHLDWALQCTRGVKA